MFVSEIEIERMSAAASLAGGPKATVGLRYGDTPTVSGSSKYRMGEHELSDVMGFCIL